MTICHSPSSDASPKAAKPSQKCARMSRLLDTAHSLLRRGHAQEGRQIDHADLAPHSLVADPAILVTGHVSVSRLVEARGDGRDEAGDQHGVDGRAVDQEAM